MPLPKALHDGLRKTLAQPIDPREAVPYHPAAPRASRRKARVYWIVQRRDHALARLATRFLPLRLVVNGVSRLLTKAETKFMHAVRDVSSVENDLVDGRCAPGDVIVIYARGTTEPGNVGTIVGPPFFTALKEQAGRRLGPRRKVAIQGVNYNAHVPAYFDGGDEIGSRKMAELAAQAVEQYPDSKVVLSGWSQGAQLVHRATQLLPPEVTRAISSIVLFGDPENGHPMPNTDPRKLFVACHKGDNIMVGGDLILPPHLTYAIEADAAADFVISKALGVDEGTR